MQSIWRYSRTARATKKRQNVPRPKELTDSVALPPSTAGVLRTAETITDSGVAGRLVLFHHAPGRTDDEVEAIAAAAAGASPVPVLAAAEGLTLDV